MVRNVYTFVNMNANKSDRPLGGLLVYLKSPKKLHNNMENSHTVLIIVE